MKILLILCFALTSIISTSSYATSKYGATTPEHTRPGYPGLDYWKKSKLGDFKRDPGHPDTCIVHKKPLPWVACAPGGTNRVNDDRNHCMAQLRRGVFNDVLDSKGRPATNLTMGCFIFPEGPRCCNYCPAQFARFCPDS